MSLLKLLDRPITFHRVFVDITGSINAALMLSNAIYWTNRLPNEREGWFHKTREEWTAETGLTVREQETAQQKLIALGLVDTRRGKVDMALSVTVMWFRVNVEALTAALSSDTKTRKTQITKTRKTQHQNAENADCSPFRSKNINYPQDTPPPPRARAFPMSDGWNPSEDAETAITADGKIEKRFSAECLSEFRLYWATRGISRTDAEWQSAFIRQVRREFAYQQAHQNKPKEDRRNEPSKRVFSRTNQEFGRKGSEKRETLTERSERYERFAAGLDASIAATERARNAARTSSDSIFGEFTREQ